MSKTRCHKCEAWVTVEQCFDDKGCLDAIVRCWNCGSWTCVEEVERSDAIRHGDQRYREGLEGFARWLDMWMERGRWPDVSDPVVRRAGMCEGEPLTMSNTARLVRAYADAALAEEVEG